jgi:nucleoporin NUP2
VPTTDENANSRDGTPFSEASAGADDEEIFPGEEDEETLYSIKCRVSKLTKTEGKSEWKAMGTGQMKLKKHTKTGSRRLLHRDSNSKRILIVS